MKTEVTVAVIGAGSGGLNALRVLNHSPADAETTFKATAFEQSSRIGGTWFYTECVGTDELGLPVHSSMYKNLRTNLPKECMGYPDFPFPPHLPSFVTHQDTYKYLQDYAAHFDLEKDVKFKTIVEHVEPIPDENKPFGVKWEVTTADVTNRTNKQTHSFDAVLVSNGHLAKPKLPKVPGLDTFEGQVLHSHDYKEPGTYADKRVVVLGAGESGLDIACEIAPVAAKVRLSHNQSNLSTILHPKVEQKPGIKCCRRGNVVEFIDGSQMEADAVILCTGFQHVFGFLDESAGIKAEDGRVTSLYKHFLSVDHPSLGLIGLLNSGPSFLISHVQSVFFRSILEGRGTLPSRKEMLKEEEDDFQVSLNEGYRPRDAHLLWWRMFDYFKELSDMGRFEHLPPVLEKIYNTAIHLRRTDLTTYRRINFVVSEDYTDFQLIDSLTGQSSQICLDN